MKGIIFIASAVFIVNIISGTFLNTYKKLKHESIEGDPGDALILTPLIEQNKTEEAREAAAVNSSLFLGLESYSGYFTVNEVYNSNTFFWFFPSQSDYENDPVLLWLQGGPGETSLFGLFLENGPFSVNKNLKLTLRENSWTKSHSVLYIDNPIGTGYSFSTGGYAQNETKIGQDLYSALIQFFTLFPELQKNEFYISGETYAGKYIPAIGHKILKENPEASLKINLQGLVIGDGFTDPEHLLNYGDYLFQIGLIDSNTREQFKENEREMVRLIHAGEFSKAFDILNDQTDNLFMPTTGFDNWKNFLYPKDPVDEDSMAKFVQQADIRSAIHVGSTVLDGEPVNENLVGDMMQTVAPWIAELLDNYRVLFYNGQMDMVVAYPLTISVLQNLEFDAADEYKVAERQIWRVDDEIAGYVKQAGNLTEILVRNAGHMVPIDKSKWAADIIYKFTRNQPFSQRD